MRILRHLVATLIGLAVAGLIVFWVFGKASEQGATQDGSHRVADALGSSCGRAGDAAKYRPALSDDKGPIISLSSRATERWVDGVQRASSLCTTEVSVGETEVRLVFVTDKLEESAADLAVIGAVAAAFAEPVAPARIKARIQSDGRVRELLASRDAWRLVEAHLAQSKAPRTLASIARFQRDAGLTSNELRLGQWVPA